MAFRCEQAISDLRARLSSMYYPNNRLQNDDQNIIQSDGVSPTLVPSNGYTFDRIPSQVSSSGRAGGGSLGRAPHLCAIMPRPCACVDFMALVSVRIPVHGILLTQASLMGFLPCSHALSLTPS